MKPLRICLINAGFDTSLKTPAQLLERYWHVPRLGDALVESGHQVAVIQAFHRSEALQGGKLSIEFIAAQNKSRREWVEIKRLADIAAALESMDPDVVHFFGMTMLPLRRALGDWCQTHGVSLAASFHGGRPSRNPFRWWRQQRALATTSAFFFPNASIAKRWRSARMLPDGARISVAAEVSSPFSGIENEIAREKLGVNSGPVFAWSGHLSASKDPLTALKGMARIVRSWPDALLMMAFQSDEILPEINAFLAQNAALKNNVKLLGAMEHSDMETLFSAADFFVHSSRREWGSNSLVEAMSCGAIPVVSDIPSLRALTEEIDPAIRFEVGDYKSLARQVLDIPLDEIERLSQQVQSAFVEHLSYPVLAAKYGAIFEALAAGDNPGSRS